MGRSINKEEMLVKLAIAEGLDTISNRLWVDFKLNPRKLTVHQQHRLDQLSDVLYTLMLEAVEDHGVLQSQYED
jgi:hypothetical protein